MPVDEFGNRADVFQYGGSTFGRMTPGQLTEQAIGASGRDLIKRIRRGYDFGDFEQLEWDQVYKVVTDGGDEYAKHWYDHLLKWYHLIVPDSDYLVAKELLDEGDAWLEHLVHVILYGNEPYGMYITRMSDSETVMSEILNKLNNSEYRPEMSPVRYKWPGDKEFSYTVSDVLIGPNTFIPLEKTATDGSGISSSKTGHFGTTVRMSPNERYTVPCRETGTKTMGEAENRNMAAHMGGEALAEIMDANNNPAVHKEICRSIITADKPTDIEDAANRDANPLGEHRVLQWMQQQFLCSGKGVRRDRRKG